VAAEPACPRWRCGEPGCKAHTRWQPVPATRPADDRAAALAALTAHYATAHPDLVEEVTGHVQLA
jgi:hypothetical protein